jgi:hypothetical protein
VNQPEPSPEVTRAWSLIPLVIGGRCVYCEKRIAVMRARKADGIENLVYHSRCDKAAQYWRNWDAS